MPALHLFNPGHETAVLLGSLNYTPPANIKQMTEDLALLPLWYAEPSDLIYTGNKPEQDFLDSLPKELPSFASPLEEQAIDRKKQYTATPWGVSPHALSLLEKAAKHHSFDLKVPIWKESYKDLTGRQSTFLCHKLLSNQSILSGLPQVPELTYSIDSFEQLLLKAELPAVVKTPYSSSGRGVLWIRNNELTNAEKNWIKGSIKKQGFVSIEKGLDKKLDFALEFYSNGKGAVQYEGISVFITEGNGSYVGNKLASQKVLHNEVESMSGQSIEQISQAVSDVLITVYGKHYEGYLGVDMMLYESNGKTAIHPCVEVNMRRTMGVVALQLFERFINSSTLGSFHVTFDKIAGNALNQHLELKQRYPLHITNGKIDAGYLSLCPVSEHTHYRAFILISP